MTIESIVLGVVILTMLIILIKEWLAPDVTVFLALSVIYFLGILSPMEAFSGFSNPSVLTVALLFIIGSAVRNSGILFILVTKILGSTHKLSWITVKMMSPVAFFLPF